MQDEIDLDNVRIVKDGKVFTLGGDEVALAMPPARRRDLAPGVVTYEDDPMADAVARAARDPVRRATPAWVAASIALGMGVGMGIPRIGRGAPRPQHVPTAEDEARKERAKAKRARKAARRKGGG